ncbi:MAG: hypothetical protein QF357_12480 [Dehalococcoidia bacterium]|nr:hypothetical protein [Dehalococcoidia bacterium]
MRAAWRAVRNRSVLLPLLPVSLFAFFVLGACSGSGDEKVEPTPTTDPTATATTVPPAPVDPTPTTPPATATVAVVETATATAIPRPAPTSTPVSVPPTATAAPAVSQPTATAVPSPTHTPVPTTTPEPTATAFPLGGDFFLNLIEPAELDVFAVSSFLEIVGQTRVDAVVTVNDDVIEPDADGMFQHTVILEVDINIIEVVASVSSDEQENIVITAVYLP